MTISDAGDGRKLARMALGFALGVLSIPVMIVFARPHADEVSDADFYQAPREARYDLLKDAAASDRFEERVVVGSSIVDEGFNPAAGDPTARYGLNGMRVDETTQIVRSLLNRPRPPKIVIVDWSALHDVPYELLPLQRDILTYYSLDYLKFALAHHFEERGKAVRRGNGTWRRLEHRNRFGQKSFEKTLAFGTLFAKYSRFPDFAKDLGAMCQGTRTRFVILRFPVFQRGNERKAQESLGKLDTADYRAMLEATGCDAEFVDLLAETLEGGGRDKPFMEDPNRWLDFSHFTPSVGEELLEDPRLGGAGDVAKEAQGSQPNTAPPALTPR